MDWIKKKDLVVGKRYKVAANNFEEATWNGVGFDGMRFKFGMWFQDEELHYDDGPPYGTVMPLEELPDET